MAPVLVVLMDRAFFHASFSEGWRARRSLYLGLTATWLVLIGLQFTAPRAMSAGFTAHDADVWTYLLNQAMVRCHARSAAALLYRCGVASLLKPCTASG